MIKTFGTHNATTLELLRDDRLCKQDVHHCSFVYSILICTGHDPPITWGEPDQTLRERMIQRLRGNAEIRARIHAELARRRLE